MKNTIIILFIFSLFFTGCSSSYSIKGYSSKDRFYRDFNRSADKKDLNITLLNDSLVQITGGGILKHDTLYTSEYIFPVNIIKTINYTNTLKSSIFGMLIGEVAIVIASAPIFANNINVFNFATLIKYAAIVELSGCFFGGIAGFYIGWDVTYQFNP